MPSKKQSIEQMTNEILDIPEKLTILPLRDVVLFPYMIYPVLIGRPSSLKAVSDAMERNKYIFVTAQQDSTVNEPTMKDLYKYGTIAKINQVLRLPNNLLKVLVEGVYQGKIISPVRNAERLEAKIEIITPIVEHSKEFEAISRKTNALFAQYVQENDNIPQEILATFENQDSPVKQLFFAAASVNQKVENKQKILEKSPFIKQYYELYSILSSEIELLKIEEEIETKVNGSMQRTQKRFFIQEQIRALQNELEDDDEAIPELASLKEALEKAGLPVEVKTKAQEEFDKLKKTSPMSPEHSVLRSFLETIASLPWSVSTEDNLNINHVKAILDEDHYDLEKPKDRILEYIAILNLVGEIKGQILCLVGPPGVGKTSLARSIARALGRKFVRISLGGVRDEAEIRGHRRTYIGSMPGKIIQSMKKAGTVNPVILLDEVDKMSNDFRGDPAAALLEVLDPEQNSAFNDHYLEVDYDLSKVLFITTANVKYDIPLPLLDRMEVIELSSYLEDAKVEIAERHILPKIIKEFALDNVQLDFTREAIIKVIQEHTREAGVRNLERELSSVLRKLAREIITQSTTQNKKSKKASADAHNSTFAEQFNKYVENKKFTVVESDIDRLLKISKFKRKPEKLQDKIGVATGLAWTSVGGDTLPVEVSMMPGSEKLTLTGKLGDVMKESAMAALTYVRSDWAKLGVPEDFSKSKEIHIHVPEGAIPKDGPSAGITMTMALVSAASGRPLCGDVAMTGEVTLRGDVLPIGGLGEKLLAARREGIKTVLIPKENEKDLVEISDVILKDLTIVPVDSILEALPIALRDRGESNNKPTVAKTKKTVQKK